jgi:hypothetical protein
LVRVLRHRTAERRTHAARIDPGSDRVLIDAVRNA